MCKSRFAIPGSLKRSNATAIRFQSMCVASSRTSRSEPLTVAVVVNGIVTAIAHSYQERDGHMFGTLIPETALRDGNNTVAAFVVDKF